MGLPTDVSFSYSYAHHPSMEISTLFNNCILTLSISQGKGAITHSKWLQTAYTKLCSFLQRRTILESYPEVRIYRGNTLRKNKFAKLGRDTGYIENIGYYGKCYGANFLFNGKERV